LIAGPCYSPTPAYTCPFACNAATSTTVAQPLLILAVTFSIPPPFFFCLFDHPLIHAHLYSACLFCLLFPIFTLTHLFTTNWPAHLFRSIDMFACVHACSAHLFVHASHGLLTCQCICTSTSTLLPIHSVIHSLCYLFTLLTIYTLITHSHSYPLLTCPPTYSPIYQCVHLSVPACQCSPSYWPAPIPFPTVDAFTVAFPPSLHPNTYSFIDM